MVIESKQFQLFFFFLGLGLIYVGGHCLINFNDVYLNICYVEGSNFFYYLNKTIIAITLIVMFLAGVYLIVTVIASIIECRKFKAESKPGRSLKDIAKSVLFYTVIIGAIGILLLLADHVSDKEEFRVEVPGALPEKEPHKLIHCTAKIISYSPNCQSEKAGINKHISGISTLIIKKPAKYRGMAIEVNIGCNYPNADQLKAIGKECSFMANTIIFEDKKRKITSDELSIYRLQTIKRQ